MKYSFTTTVVKVEEKTAPQRITGKAEDGSWIMTCDPLGYFIVTSNNIAYSIGTESPAIKKGDKVKITIEKVEP